MKKLGIIHASLLVHFFLISNIYADVIFIPGGVSVDNFPGGGPRAGMPAVPGAPRKISWEAIEPPGAPAGVIVRSGPAFVVGASWAIEVTIDNNQDETLFDVILLIEFAADDRLPAGCPPAPVLGLWVENNVVRTELPGLFDEHCIPAFYLGDLDPDDGTDPGGADEATVTVQFSTPLVPLPDGCSDMNGDRIPDQFQAGGAGALAASTGIASMEGAGCGFIMGPFSNMSVLAEIRTFTTNVPALRAYGLLIFMSLLVLAGLSVLASRSAKH